MMISTMRTHFACSVQLLAIGLFATLGAPLALANGADSSESISPQNAKGYDRGSVYLNVDGAQVNAFNFNFVAGFPLQIGMDYPENAGISLTLNLIYNSNVWHWQRMFAGRYFFRIQRQDPYGLGFDLNLGRINSTVGANSAPFTYVGPDGASHRLFPYSGSEYRSHDGSHIRAVLTGDVWTVSFQDGLVQVLGHKVVGPTLNDMTDSHGSCDILDGEDLCPSYVIVPQANLGSGFDREFVGWHVTNVYSRADQGAAPSSYTVTYYGSTNPSDPENAFQHIFKRIEDRHGRVIETVLDTSNGTVSAIRVPAPAFENGTPRPPAEYNFYYETRSITVEGVVHTFWVLRRILGPDVAASGSPERYMHEFEYTTTASPNYGGQLRQITYPSGTATRLSYQYYPFRNGTSGTCGYGGGSSPSLGVSLIERALDGDFTNATVSNPLYRRVEFSQRTEERGPYYGEACPYTRYDQANTMIDAAGNKTEFIYRTPKEHDEANWYGLLVKQRYYGGGRTGSTPRLLKEVEYDYSQRDESVGYHADFEMLPQQIVTTWKDDEDESGSPLSSPTQLVEDRSEFDTFGHFQRSEFSGSSIGPERKVIIKDYANDCPTAGPLLTNWLGDVVIREEVRKHPSGGAESIVSRTDHGYNETRGLRTRTIQRANFAVSDPCTAAPAPAPQDDIVTDYTFTTAGDMDTQHRYLPGAPADASPTDVTLAYTYKFGARESATNTGRPAYYDFVRVIDSASGLVREERSYPTSLSDTAVLKTTFGYDALGRTTMMKSGTDDAITIAYENDVVAGAPSSAYRLARIRSRQGTGIGLTESVDYFRYDRFDEEEKLATDGSRVYRYTSYDSADRVSFLTEWTHQTTPSGVPGTSTEYAVFDGSSYLFEEPFGRPTKTTDALGGVSRFRYFGTNREVINDGVALMAGTLDAPAPVSSRYFTDGLGRLRFVSAPKVLGPGSQYDPYEDVGVSARYTYDVLDRLQQVDLSSSGTIDPTSQDRFHGTAPNPQARTFAYNNLGQIQSVTSPEAGTAHSDRWNVYGTPTRSWDDEAGLRHYQVQTTFDIAGRPTRISKIRVPQSDLNQVYSAGAGGWTLSGDWRVDTTGSCVLGTPAWYIGDSNCRYAQADTPNTTLKSPIVLVGADTILTFKYFREVHGDAPGSTGRDVLRVQIRDAGVSPEQWSDVYVLDSTQISRAKWVQSPAIDLGRWMPTEAPAGQAQIRFVFESGGHNNELNLKGIGIAQVTVSERSETVLQDTLYDQTFGISKNLVRGKPTTLVEYDEATRAPAFTRELHYTAANGRLSDERITFTWDGSGAPSTLQTKYVYDTRGGLISQRMPYSLGANTRDYNYIRNHGVVIGATVSDAVGTRNVLGTQWGQGIEYDDAGGMKLVRFANNMQQHITRNAGSLVDRIWVDRDGAGATMFDTGTYGYDGAGNIKQIGADFFRYDAAARLTWSRTVSSLYGTVDLDQQYDAFGNMTAQNASLPAGSLPSGLVFSGRSYHVGSDGPTTNRIASGGGVAYDAAGRVTLEVGSAGSPNQFYDHGATGDLRVVSNGLGAWFQHAQYEGGGHRWYRSLSAEGGKALVTIRDASGQVVADFAETSSTSGLTLQKEYVRVNGQLVAINSTCGPRPALALSNPAVVSGQVWFDKIDYVQPQGSYTILITDAAGAVTSQYRPSTLSNHFSIPITDLPLGQSKIQIETDAECGHTGFSNVVVFGRYEASSAPSCLTSVGVSRSGFNGTGSNLAVIADGTCLSGTTYNIHFQPWYDELEVVTLNQGVPQLQPLITLANIPCDSGEGYYWASPVVPGGGGAEGSPSLVIYAGPDTCGGGPAPSQPGQTSMNLQFVHWDHLGSTRLVTDEQGLVIASSKFFPFGHEAETLSSDTVRQRFTGHERDKRVGLDYMLGRNCGTRQARFLEPDPVIASAALASPQSWNRYTYVENSPLNATDPTGYMLQRWVSSSPALGGPGLYTQRTPTILIQGFTQPDNQKLLDLAGVTRTEVKDQRASILMRDAAGNPVFIAQGPPESGVGLAGPATIQRGYLTTTNGFRIDAIKNLGGNKAYDTDCHGYSIADGKYWIDNKPMEAFLAYNQYIAQTPVLVQIFMPRAYDIAVFRQGGEVKHSAVLTAAGTVTMAAGVMIFEGNSKTTTVPISHAWPYPGTTVEYWRVNP